jgi:hypothetical protein
MEVGAQYVYGFCRYDNSHVAHRLARGSVVRDRTLDATSCMTSRSPWAYASMICFAEAVRILLGLPRRGRGNNVWVSHSLGGRPMCFRWLVSPARRMCSTVSGWLQPATGHISVVPSGWIALRTNACSRSTAPGIRDSLPSSLPSIAAAGAQPFSFFRTAASADPWMVAFINCGRVSIWIAPDWCTQ